MHEYGISNRGQRFQYQSYDSENDCFVLSDSANEMFISVKSFSDNREFEEKDFTIAFLIRRDLKESDIYQVFDRVRDRRMGWCIPILALESADHDFADNVHYLRYAYVASREALRLVNSGLYTKEIVATDSDVISLSSIFHESTAILIISDETMPENKKFVLEKWAPSLMSFGYVELTGTSPELLRFGRNEELNDRIYLEEVSDHVEGISFIRAICCNVIPYERNAVFKFFYLYQVFEMLLETIFREEQAAVIRELNAAGRDSGKVKDALEGARRISSEKFRIGLLLSSYGCGAVNLDELQALCNSMLKELGRKPGTTLADYFYPVRNFLFHQFRDFPSHMVPTLDEIVDETCCIVPKILARFSLPPPVPEIQPGTLA